MKRRILFILRAPLGFRGTSGMFTLIDFLSKEFQVHVVSPFVNNLKSHIVHQTDIKNTVINEKNKIKTDLQLNVLLKKFKPDVIYMINSPYCLRYILTFKPLFPEIKWILDVRTPLLSEGEQRKIIRKNCFYLQLYLDKILTLSRTSVKSWIPFLFRTTITYPLSVNLDQIKQKELNKKKQAPVKFVYIGTLHQHRKLEFLITSFGQYAKQTNNNIILHIFGSGPEEATLKGLVAKLKLDNIVQFKGILHQIELFQILNEYDAGIAYVPYDKYNFSPSLKSIEYAAAGLHVIASDTEAHVACNQEGFDFDLFSNTEESFVSAIKAYIELEDDRLSIEANLRATKKYHCNNVSKNYILPQIKLLIGDK